MEILPLYSQYVFSLLKYVVGNKYLFTKILAVHNHDTTAANNFHLPTTNLTKHQTGTYYTGIQNLNYLPTHTKNVAS
jgi:hypothetical protein